MVAPVLTIRHHVLLYGHTAVAILAQDRAHRLHGRRLGFDGDLEPLHLISRQYAEGSMQRHALFLPTAYCLLRTELNAEGIFHFVEEAALAGLDPVLFELGELLEQVALTGRELRGGAHAHRHVLVATAHAAQVRDAFLAQTECLARLRARGNGEHLAPVDGRHLHLVAESSLREGDRQLVEDVAPFALEEGVGLDLEHDVEVAGGTAFGAGLAFAGEANLLPAVDARRDLHGQLARLAHTALSMAGVAGRADDATLAVAAPTRRHVHELAEDALLDAPHLATTFALRADGRLRVGLRAAPLADAARFEARDLKGLLGAEDSLLERDREVITQVGAPLRAAPRAPPRRAAKEGVELLEDVGEGAEALEALEAAVALAVESGVAKLVVDAALLRVGEDFVGLADFFEAHLSVGRLVDVGVVLARKLAEGALQLVLARVARDAQHFIVITFRRRHPQ